MKKRNFSQFRVSRALLAGISMTPLAYATDFTWNSAGPTNNWNLSDLNWGATPWGNDVGNNAIFGGTAETVTLTAPITAGTVSFTTAGYTLAGDATNTLAVGTIDTTVAASGTTTISGVISGTGPLTLKATGNLSATGGNDSGLGIRLSNAANTFTGDVTITSGLVSYANNASFGNAANKIILNGGGLLDNNQNIALSRDIQVLAGGGTFRTYGSANVTWSGAITGSGNINRTDGGTLNLSGDLSGYSGTYNNQGGNTNVTGSANLGGNWTVSAGTLNVTGTKTISGAINVAGGVLQIGSLANGGASALSIGNGGTLRYAGTGAETRSGTINTNNGAATIEVTNASASLTLWRTAGTSNQAITKTGAGTLRYGANGDNSGASAIVNAGVLEAISSANNNFANVTVNNSGTFRLGTTDGAGNALTADHQIWNGGSLTVNTGGTFLQNGMDESVSVLNIRGGTISGAGTLSAGTIAAESGTVSTRLAGVAALTKTTAGTLSLSGNNGYTGGTNVNLGTLQAGNATALGTGNVTIGGGNLTTTLGNLSLGNGSLSLNSGSLTLNGATAGTVTLGANQDFTMAGGQWTLNLVAGLDQILGSGAGADFLISGGTLDLGGGLINYGATYQLLSGFTTGSVSGLTISNYDSTNFIASLGNNGLLSFTAVPEPSIALLGGLGALGLLRRRRNGN